jgi:hypothetical protein
VNQDSHVNIVLRRYSPFILYAAITFAVLFESAASALYFSSGRLIFALWSIAAIFVLPRAVLGLLLLGSRDPGLPLFMPKLISRVFGKRLDHHRLGYSRMLYFDPTWRLVVAFGQELVMLVLALIPLAVLA